MIERFKHGAAIGQLAQTVEADGIQPLEDIAVLAVPWGAAVLLNETLNLLEARDDAFLARRATGLVLRLNLNAKLFEQRVILVGKAFSHALPPSAYATPAAMRFSQAPDEVIDGSRPRSCLNFKARLASSRASSMVRLARLAPITAATCFRLSSLMVFARMA